MVMMVMKAVWSSDLPLCLCDRLNIDRGFSFLVTAEMFWSDPPRDSKLRLKTRRGQRPSALQVRAQRSRERATEKKKKKETNKSNKNVEKGDKKGDKNSEKQEKYISSQGAVFGFRGVEKGDKNVNKVKKTQQQANKNMEKCKTKVTKKDVSWCQGAKERDHGPQSGVSGSEALLQFSANNKKSCGAFYQHDTAARCLLSRGPWMLRGCQQKVS